MARSDDRFFLSVPCPVLWEGWESTTARLFSHGWSLTVERNRLHDRNLTILMQHPFGMKLLAVANDVDSYSTLLERRPPIFWVKQMAQHMHMVVHHSGPLDMNSMFYNATGQMVMSTEVDLDRVPGLFAPVKPQVQQIIVEPKSVEECFNLIKKLQAPDLARIREQNRKREPLLQAQILSFA